MAIINTGSFPKALWPGVHKWWGAKYDQHEVEYKEIFDVRSSTKNFEELVQTSGFGLVPVKEEGDGVKYDNNTQGYTSRFVHTAFGLGYIVTKEEIADNQYTEVSMARASSLAFSCRQTEERVGANVLNNGFDSNFTGGDSLELYSLVHVEYGNTQSNHLTTAADISEAALEDMAIQIMLAKDPRGLNISLRPKRLIIPPNLCFEVERILQSQLQNDSANNATNALRTKGVIPEVVINHYLTDTDAWHVSTTAENGLIWFDREKAQFTHDGDFDTENDKSKVYRRFSVGWGDYRGSWGSPGA